MIKIKFTDYGRCLVCLHNPCDCKRTKNKPKQVTGKETMVEEIKKDIYGTLRIFGIPKKRAFIVANLVEVRLKLELLEELGMNKL